MSQRSEIKGQRAAAEDSAVDVMDEKKLNEPKGESMADVMIRYRLFTIREVSVQC